MSAIEDPAIREALRAPADDAAGASARLVERAAAEDLVDVAYATHETPLGTAILAATPRGLIRLGLPGSDPDELLAGLAAAASPRVLRMPRRLDRARRELDEYFAGRRREFDLDLDWSLVPGGFYRRVLESAERRLPFGVTASYGEVAAWAGNARACRAAGTALARNPLPIVVPCHRVLRAGGALGRYGGGPEMKASLLRLEGAIGP